MKKTHGLSRTRVYSIWQTIKQRTNNPNDDSYPYYGGRGIALCDRWHDFQNFLEDMGEPSANSYTLDRVNNDGNYEPSNCRWATRREQNLNKRHKKGMSGIRGVSFSKKDKRWRAYASLNHKYIHLGNFLTKEEATNARQKHEAAWGIPLEDYLLMTQEA